MQEEVLDRVMEEQEDIFVPVEKITIDIILASITPILMHRYVSGEKVSSRKLTDTYDEEWKSTAYVNSEGFLYVPDINIEAAIMTAGKSRKIGKFFLKKYIASGVVVEDQFPKITVKGKQITLEDVARNNWIFTCGAVVGNSRIDRRRVCLREWELSFMIGLRSPLITPSELKNILIDAGTYAGLCDQRPSSPNKPGKFGQFYVKKFEF